MDMKDTHPNSVMLARASQLASEWESGNPEASQGIILLGQAMQALEDAGMSEDMLTMAAQIWGLAED